MGQTLWHLSRSVERRAVALRQLVEGLPTTPSPVADRLVAYTTIEALNLWAQFSRAFYLACCFGAVSRSGQPVSVAIYFGTRDDALTHAVRTMGSSRKSGPPWTRRDEPTWHDPNVVLKLLGSLKASNLGNVQGAFGYQTRVFRDLPTVRNFYAHRNEETARKVGTLARRFGQSSRRRPTELMCTRLGNRPQTILADWLDDIRNVVVLVCS